MTAIPPPPRRLWAAELPRAAWTIMSLIGARTALTAAPPGDGRPVMVLPGLINADRSNYVLRRFLTGLGYTTIGWGLGRNFGTRSIGPEGERLFAAIRAFHAETGAPVTLIGVSLGGIMARFAAHRLPGIVREVITISSPFAGSPRATNVWRTFQIVTGDQIDGPRVMARTAEIAAPLPVPSTAIWSRSDGLVNGLICHGEGDPLARDIEIDGSHMAVQMRPAVLLAIAAVLAGRAYCADTPAQIG